MENPLETIRNCILLTSETTFKNSKSSLTYWGIVTLISIASVLPGIENKYYAPFVKATNIALACLEEIKVDGMRAASVNVDMICQKNDWPLLQDHQGEQSTRKPDVVILPWKKLHDDKPVAETNHRVIKATMAPEARLLWQNVLALIEFKRHTKQPSPPPLSYKVKDYIPTKPEYRRVEPPVPDAPATATADSSQPRASQPAPAPPSK